MRFVSSGTEATMSALRAARGFTGRPRIIKVDGGYHGHSDALLAKAGSGVVSLGLPGSSGVTPAAVADTLVVPYNDLDAMRSAFEEHRDEIAALIVEPIPANMGVVLPRPAYLPLLRNLCDEHGTLLIFDEVITGFGRLGHAFAAERYGVIPDLITFAKGITSGTVPMGGVIARAPIYQAFMQGPEHVVELFHGYTYSAHPLACAASLGTLETYADEGLLTRAAKMAPSFEHAVHSLDESPHVIDVRNIGLVGAIELESIPGAPGKRGFDVFRTCFERGVLIRTTGDIIALSPPLIVEDAHIDQAISTIADVLKTVA